MKYNEVEKIVGAIKDGAFTHMEYVGDLSKYVSASAKKQGYVVTKETSCVVRKGIDYDSQKAVKEMVENGYQLTHELPWGEWVQGSENFITHKGNMYVRLYLADNTPKTVYYVNGNPTDKQGLIDMGIMLNSWVTRDSEKPLAITVNVENITALG